jgi:GNAT superfamily N-acetyltransferase
MTLTFSKTELRRIEEISQNASRPERGAMVDGWSVGLSPSKAKRSRCVNPFYASTRSFETNLAAVRSLYRTAKLPCVFRITPFIFDASIDQKLAAMKCDTFDETHVQLRALSPGFVAEISEFNTNIDYCIKSAFAPDEIGRTVRMLREDSVEEITALVSRWKTMVQPIRSYTAYDMRAVDGETHRPAAHVLTIADEHTVGVFDVVTHAEHRGRGLASALIARALADAHASGATTAYLQVVGVNPARRVYERLGFRTAYTYWYRQVGDE